MKTKKRSAIYNYFKTVIRTINILHSFFKIFKHYAILIANIYNLSHAINANKAESLSFPF